MGCCQCYRKKYFLAIFANLVPFKTHLILVIYFREFPVIPWRSTSQAVANVLQKTQHIAEKGVIYSGFVLSVCCRSHCVLYPVHPMRIKLTTGMFFADMFLPGVPIVGFCCNLYICSIEHKFAPQK